MNTYIRGCANTFTFKLDLPSTRSLTYDRWDMSVSEPLESFLLRVYIFINEYAVTPDKSFGDFSLCYRDTPDTFFVSFGKVWNISYVRVNIL